MRCPNCGNVLKRDITYCPNCGNKIENNNVNLSNRELLFTKYKKQFSVGLAVVLFLIYLCVFSCGTVICPLPHGFKSDYCFVHICSRDNCNNKKALNEKYCYIHLPSKTPNINYTPEKAEDVLEFSNIKISHNSSYTVCTGTITNNGNKTYSFVEVKGKFKNSSGTVLDTDWTYAVGSEGLAPKESTTFRLSVDKNVSISKCTMEIIDYDKD